MFLKKRNSLQKFKSPLILKFLSFLSQSLVCNNVTVFTLTTNPLGLFMKTAKPSLGWREWAKLPKLSTKKIKVKVDTGARTSALHAVNIKISGIKRKTVHFDFHPDQDGGKLIHCKAPLIDTRKVKSSNGISSLRPVIELEIVIGAHKWLIEVTLVNRDIMGFRMLLGRQALKERFLVDPGKSFLLSKNLK